MEQISNKQIACMFAKIMTEMQGMKTEMQSVKSEVKAAKETKDQKLENIEQTQTKMQNSIAEVRKTQKSKEEKNNMLVGVVNRQKLEIQELRSRLETVEKKHDVPKPRNKRRGIQRRGKVHGSSERLFQKQNGNYHRDQNKKSLQTW